MADYSGRQRRANLIVGSFVLLAFAGFVWMVYMFGALPTAVGRLRSFVVLVNFPNAGGIHDNTPVRYAGYQIGRVIAISPPFLFTEPDTGRQYHQVKVTLAIDRRFMTIPANVDVFITRRGLGAAFIEFEFDPDRKIAGFLRDEMVLQGQMGSTSEFFPRGLEDRIEELVAAVTDLAGSANAILGDGENQDNIREAIANIRAATADAGDTLRSFRGLSELASERLDQTAGKANETLDSIKGLADAGTERLEETAEQLTAAISSMRVIMRQIEEGEGTAGKLVNDPRLYESLIESGRELELVLDQLKNFVAESRDRGLRLRWF